MRKTIIFIFVSFASFAQVQPLEMKSNTEGFSVGVQLNTLGWSSKYFTVLDEEEPSGYGVGIELGYGITQRFELIGRFDFSTLAIQNDWDYFTFNNAELLARFNPGSTTKRFRPYVEIGAASANIGVSPILFNNNLVAYNMSGFAIAYGGGFNYFLNRNLLITLNAAGSSGSISDFTVDGTFIEDKPDVSNFRVRLGARFYFKDL